METGKDERSSRLNRSSLSKFLASGRSQKRDSLRVLVVSETEDTRTWIQQVAESRGVRATVEDGTDEAIVNLTIEDPPDLVLVDALDDPESLESIEPFVVYLRLNCSDSRIALMASPGVACRLAESLTDDSVIVLRTPVERADIVNLITLIQLADARH